jgi:hypothetical protein
MPRRLATLTYRIDVASNREPLVSATVSEIVPAGEDHPQGAQACFDRLLREGGGSATRRSAPGCANG